MQQSTDQLPGREKRTGLLIHINRTVYENSLHHPARKKYLGQYRATGFLLAILNDRGHKDAPAMAERLRDKKIEIDAFVSSPAKRARQTCEHFYEVLGKGKDPILLLNEVVPCTQRNILYSDRRNGR